MSVSQNRVRYTPVSVGVNATVTFTSNSIGGFLCLTAGTVAISSPNEYTGAATTLFTVAVSAGTWLDLPFYIGKNGGSVTTAGGASGVLGV